MAQTPAVALHLGWRVVRTLLRDHSGAKAAELPPLTQPRGTRILPCPKVPPALPFTGSGSLVSPKAGHTGSRAHGELVTRSTVSTGRFAVLWGPLPWLSGSQTRGIVSPWLWGFPCLLLQDTPSSGRAMVPWHSRSDRAGAGPRSGCGAVPRGALWAVALSSRHPRACPSDGCLSQVSAGHRRWRFLGAAANPPFGPAVLHTGSQGWHLPWLLGSRVPKAQTWAQGTRMVPLSSQAGRAEGLLPCEPLFLRGSEGPSGCSHRLKHKIASAA